MKSESFPDKQVDYLLEKLEPLRRGYTVCISLQDEKFKRLKNYRGTKINQLVAMAPGTLYGFASKSVLVSVIGAGSCVVHPARMEKIGDLVSAGIPLALARHLMEKLHVLFEE